MLTLDLAGLALYLGILLIGDSNVDFHNTDLLVEGPEFLSQGLIVGEVMIDDFVDLNK